MSRWGACRGILIWGEEGREGWWGGWELVWNAEVKWKSHSFSFVRIPYIILVKQPFKCTQYYAEKRSKHLTSFTIIVCIHVLPLKKMSIVTMERNNTIRKCIEPNFVPNLKSSLNFIWKNSKKLSNKNLCSSLFFNAISGYSNCHHLQAQ